MFYALLSRVFKPQVRPVSPSVRMFAIKSVEEKGVISRQVSFDKVDNRETLNKFHVNDFKLQNILALGAYDVLKPQQLTDTNPLTVMENFQKSVDRTFKEITPKSESK